MSDFEAFRERQAHLGRTLAELGTMARDLGAKSLEERVARDLVRKLAEDRFHLVVVGEFNHGKTTFVNALLGQKVLPTGVTPTTATIHHIRYADKPEAWVVRTTGDREALPFDAARSFAVGGGADAKDVDFLEVGYPAPLLEEGVLLVDTPGVNDLSLQRADITYSYIPRADAVLFLLDAGQILKESERVFLQDKLLKASRDKIVFVITKWDLLDAGERAEAFAYAQKQLSALVKSPSVFPVSAERALAGDPGSGFPELLSHLTSYLAQERGRILLDNALGEGLAVSELLSRGIVARRRAVAMKGEELDRKISILEQDLQGQAGTVMERRSALREQAQGIKVGAKKDLERFADDVIRQLPGVIDSAKKDDLQKFLPAFLEETFKKWAEAETKEIATSLEELAERTVALVREDAHAASKRLSDTLGATAVAPLAVEINTFNYDVGIFALFVGGFAVMFANVLLGGLMTLAAPVLALVVKERVEGEYRQRAKEQAPALVRTAVSKMGPKLDEMVDEFVRKLDEWVEHASAELHREVLEVLSATRRARHEGEPDEAGAQASLAEQEARLSDLTTRMEAERAALWAQPLSTGSAEERAVRLAPDVLH